MREPLTILLDTVYLDLRDVSFPGCDRGFGGMIIYVD